MKAKVRRPSAATAREHKLSDKEQYERFRKAARELGTDESEEAFERAFRKVVRPKPATPSGRE
jgi:hypothetical protein